MNILLIEPSHIMAENYQKALEQAGHNVRRQPEAQSAIFQTEENTPDMIVLELQMPLHNGIEFLYELRSYTEWQDIPAIVLSMAPEELVAGDKNLLSRLGVKEYLYKPQTKLNQLVAAVGRLAEPARV